MDLYNRGKASAGKGSISMKCGGLGGEEKGYWSICENSR